ncbi:hypothetical protein [Nocardia grenadensis]|uniref:hypothetical protein n=1 Tax=Nocardia grenadensis TaxID=931537 RepID=UPI003D756B45
MKAFTDEFLEAAGRLVEKETKHTVKEVLSFETRTEWSGCETCGYDETVIEIGFEDDKGRYREHTYYGTFVDLIRSLTD